MNEELTIIISAEIAELKKNMQAAQNEIKDLKNKGEKDFKGFSEAAQKAGDVSKKALAAAGVAIVGAATALLSLSSSTAEYRKNQAQLNAAFEQAKFSAESATGVYKELYGVIGDDDQAVESAANIAMLANSEKEAAQWAELAAGVVGTFHDTLQPEAFYEAANETLKLNEATGAFTQMLEQTGVMSVDDFNKKLAECTTEAEKQALMLSVTEKAVGTAGESYKKNAAEIIAQNEAQAKLNDTMAELGEAMTPINTMLAEFAAIVLEEVTPIIKEFAENHGQQIKETLTGIAEGIGSVIGWISDNWELVSTLAAIITGIAIALGVFSTAMGIVNAVMLASPVTWIVLGIVAAIAALVAIIVVVIKHWDEIKAATVKCWEAIKNAVQTAIDWVVGFFNKLINFVKENWQALLLMLVNPFAGAFKLLYDNCEGFRNFIDNFITKVKEGFKNGFEAAKNFIVTPIKNAKETALKIFDNIRDGFSEKINKAKDLVKTAIDKIKSFFSFKWELPTIKTPKITINWETEGVLAKAAQFIGLKGLPKFNVAWNALGGVFDKPTLFNYGGSLQGIGENGAEAVVPLEKNTMWLDRLATMLNEKQSTQPIILKVGEKTLGEVTIGAINNITKQTGNLPLVLG